MLDGTALLVEPVLPDVAVGCLEDTAEMLPDEASLIEDVAAAVEDVLYGYV